MATDNEQKIELLNKEILRESSILQELSKSLVVEETEANSLMLFHKRNEVENIKVKIKRMNDLIKKLRSKRSWLRS